jgi:hypothetical protein
VKKRSLTVGGLAALALDPDLPSTTLSQRYWAYARVGLRFCSLDRKNGQLQAVPLTRKSYLENRFMALNGRYQIKAEIQLYRSCQESTPVNICGREQGTEVPKTSDFGARSWTLRFHVFFRGSRDELIRMPCLKISDGYTSPYVRKERSITTPRDDLT